MAPAPNTGFVFAEMALGTILAWGAVDYWLACYGADYTFSAWLNRIGHMQPIVPALIVGAAALICGHLFWER